MLRWQYQETIQSRYEPKKHQARSNSTSFSLDASQNQQQDRHPKQSKPLQRKTDALPPKELNILQNRNENLPAPLHGKEKRLASPRRQPRKSSWVREAIANSRHSKTSSPHRTSSTHHKDGGSRMSSSSRRSRVSSSSRRDGRLSSSPAEYTDASSVAADAGSVAVSEKRPLWGNLTRRAWQNYESSAAHAPIMRQVMPLLRATVVTGFASGECTPWADANEKGLLSRLIGNIWTEVACRNGEVSNEIDEDVEEVPDPMEAKKV